VAQRAVTPAALALASPAPSPASPPAAPPSPARGEEVATELGPPDPPEPAQLVCEPGTRAIAPRVGEPTWVCARPDGTRHGAFFTLFPDGQPEITGSYKDGALDGAWQRRAATGAIVESGRYAAGRKSGTWRMSSAAGEALGEYEMRAGTGTEKHWLDDGTLYSERALRAGIPAGPERVYGPEGTALISAGWLAGKLDGPRSAGTRVTLRIEESFAAGVRRGNRQIWQQSQLLLDENYDTRGKRDGDYTIWRNKKVMRVHGAYEHGKRDGLWTWSDRDGNKEREGNYLAGKRDGPWTEWIDSAIVATASYSQGKPDGEFIYYDRSQNELGRFELVHGSGTMLTFWPNKKVASRQRLSQGMADGPYQELTSRGKVVVEGRFRNDAKHGVWKEWTAEGVLTLEQSWKRGKLDGVVRKYADGKLISEANYKDGKATGHYAEYRAGTLAVTGEFANDRKTGTWTQYDAEGRTQLTATYKDGVLDGSWRQRIDGGVLEGNLTQGRRTGVWTRTDRAGGVRQLTYPVP
jgi:antitoxin component YwqK of YwqJK toxin-antitoxin module